MNHIKLGVGVILFFIALLIGLSLSGAAFVTFVVGLFITFPFTLVNVLKIWAAMIALSIVTGGVKITVNK